MQLMLAQPRRATSDIPDASDICLDCLASGCKFTDKPSNAVLKEILLLLRLTSCKSHT